jgi:hypothetical protein
MAKYILGEKIIGKDIRSVRRYVFQEYGIDILSSGHYWVPYVSRPLQSQPLDLSVRGLGTEFGMGVSKYSRDEIPKVIKTLEKFAKMTEEGRGSVTWTLRRNVCRNCSEELRTRNHILKHLRTKHNLNVEYEQTRGFI